VRRASLAVALAAVALAPGRARATPSSYSVAPAGTKVLYLFVEDLGYKVTRVFDLDEVDAGAHALVMLAPASGREGRRVTEWVSRGHKLVLAPPLLSEDGFCQDFKFGKLEIKRARAFSMTATSHRDLNLRASACSLAVPPTGRAVAGRPDRALAFDHAAGSGLMLILAHEDVLVNMSLDRDDIAVLLRRWLLENVPRGSRVVFVEGKQGGQLLEIVRRANLMPFLAHGLAFLLLLYWMLAPRFGDPSPTVASLRRAFAQHAHALGRLYRHRRASAYALKRQYDRFLERVLGRGERRGKGFSVGGARERGEALRLGRERASLAARIATRSGRDPDGVESILAQVEYGVASAETPDPREVQHHFRLSQSPAALERTSAARASKRKKKR
jgi:hypothetical protein